ncbi:MAG: hypothetical protein DBX97_23320 [Collinsella tanakaei]|nr:MAG: hypothetical protein DBX97_23320 [Collinsella tanakaei]
MLMVILELWIIGYKIFVLIVILYCRIYLKTLWVLLKKVVLMVLKSLMTLKTILKNLNPELLKMVNLLVLIVLLMMMVD